MIREVEKIHLGEAKGDKANKRIGLPEIYSFTLRARVTALESTISHLHYFPHSSSLT